MQAFTAMCDLLVDISEKLENMSLFYQLVCYGESYLLQTPNSFVQLYVFVEVDTGKQDEDLTKRQNYLYRFCKLVSSNVCPSVAADVFRHYLHFNRGYGDIIKVTLENVLDDDIVTYTDLLLVLLKNLCDLHRDAENRIDRNTQGFADVKVRGINEIIIERFVFSKFIVTEFGRTICGLIRSGKLD